MSDQNSEERRDGVALKKRSLVLLALLFLVAGMAVAGLTVHFTQDQNAPPVLPPDTLPEAEDRAVPTGEDGTPASGGGGSVRMSFTDQVNISLADKEATFHFATPSSSNQSMVVDLIIQDTLILRSGGLAPGYRLESLPLLDNAVLQPGGYDGLLRVSFYDPDTGQKAAVDAEIPVKVTVAETFAEEGGT